MYTSQRKWEESESEKDTPKCCDNQTRKGLKKEWWDNKCEEAITLRKEKF